MVFFTGSNNSDNVDEINAVKGKYYELRSRIYDELKEYGCCSEFDQLVNNGYNRFIDALTWISVKDAYTAYIEGRELKSEEGDKHSDTRYDWVDIEHKSLNIDKRRKEIDALTRSAQVRFRKCESERRGYCESQMFNPASNVVENAKREAARIIEEAKAQANRFMQDAEAKGRQIIQDAKDDAEYIVSDAKITKKALEDEGSNNKRNLSEEGENRKRTLIDEGEKEKVKLIEEGRAEKQRIVDSLTDEEYRNGLEARIKEHFRDEQLGERKIRNNLDDDYNKLIRERNGMLNSMNTEVQGLHSSLMQSFEDALSKLQNIQGEIHTRLDTWQRKLYKNELQSLAMCFMNLDRIIMSIENKIASHLACGDEGYHKELADELGQTVKTLKILKNNFEAGLAKNSIKLLIPNVGESFNSNYHRADNYDPMTEDEDSFNGKTITAVSDAGIIRVLNAGDEIMQRAVVTVEK